MEGGHRSSCSDLKKVHEYNLPLMCLKPLFNADEGFYHENKGQAFKLLDEDWG